MKQDYIEDVERLMQELGAEEGDRLQSLDCLTVGDLVRLSEFLDGVTNTLRLAKAEAEGRAVRHPVLSE